MVSKLRSSLEIRLEGQASKRGLIPRTPDGERLLGRKEPWIAIRHPERAALLGQPHPGQRRVGDELPDRTPSSVIATGFMSLSRSAT